ncbi:hypothetical protein FWC63_01010 [Candidatus Saccharibacteria bacterium]|nr:hypothetical protein [Candidatus Saccharibacteria bacterium]
MEDILTNLGLSLPPPARWWVPEWKEHGCRFWEEAEVTELISVWQIPIYECVPRSNAGLIIGASIAGATLGVLLIVGAVLLIVKRNSKNKKRRQSKK